MAVTQRARAAAAPARRQESAARRSRQVAAGPAGAGPAGAGPAVARRCGWTLVKLNHVELVMQVTSGQRRQVQSAAAGMEAAGRSGEVRAT